MPTEQPEPQGSIDLIEAMGNVVLAKRSVRRFPGLLVQGDSLSVLLHELEMECPDASATATVRAWLECYEGAMSRHGLNLPYSR